MGRELLVPAEAGKLGSKIEIIAQIWSESRVIEQPLRERLASAVARVLSCKRLL